MTAKEFGEAQIRLGLTDAEMADRLLVHPLKIKAWLGGFEPIPSKYETLIGIITEQRRWLGRPVCHLMS